MWTTRVSNPICAPHFCILASVSITVSCLHQTIVFSICNEFYLSTENTTNLPYTRKHNNRIYIFKRFTCLNYIYVWICNLHTLYAQSFRITLAPLVLPRLLARNWSELSTKSRINSLRRHNYWYIAKDGFTKSITNFSKL